MKKLSVLAAAFALAAGLAPAQASDVNTQLMELAESELASWLQNQDLLMAVTEQNARNSGLSQDDIDALDQTWRAEISASSSPLIDDVLDRPASEYLRERKEETNGLITEVFIMDNLGLNVAQSDLTSDYWQGDEAKFQDTYGKGVGSIHISEVELDESTGTYQSQVSMVVTNQATGEAIGAITFGVNVDYLE